MVIIIGDNFFDGLQVVFGTMLVWSEVGRSFPDFLWPKNCFALGFLTSNSYSISSMKKH